MQHSLPPVLPVPERLATRCGSSSFDFSGLNGFSSCESLHNATVEDLPHDVNLFRSMADRQKPETLQNCRKSQTTVLIWRSGRRALWGLLRSLTALGILFSGTSLIAQDAVPVKAADAPPAVLKDGQIDLLSGELLEMWQIYSSETLDPTVAVWKVTVPPGETDPILVCLGTPKGYLLTKQMFENFELTMEWRYPSDANGNSGVLVFVQNEPRIWPTSIQVQLHQPKAGSIFPSGDATSDNTTDTSPDVARAIGMWNELKVRGEAGRLSVEVNGKKVGEVTGSKPVSGGIALQSEGSEVHFRKIRVRLLKPKVKDGKE